MQSLAIGYIYFLNFFSGIYDFHFIIPLHYFCTEHNNYGGNIGPRNDGNIDVSFKNDNDNDIDNYKNYNEDDVDDNGNETDITVLS